MSIKFLLFRRFYENVSSNFLSWLIFLERKFNICGRLEELEGSNKKLLTENTSKLAEATSLVDKLSGEIQNVPQKIQGAVEQYQNFLNIAICDIQQKFDCYMKIVQKQEKAILKIQEQMLTMSRGMESTSDIIADKFGNLQETICHVDTIQSYWQESFPNLQRIAIDSQQCLKNISRQVQDKVLILIDWPNLCITANKNLDKNAKYIINTSVLYFYLANKFKQYTLETRAFIHEEWNHGEEAKLKNAGFTVQRTQGDVDPTMHEDGKKLVQKLLPKLDRVIIVAGDNSYMGIALEIKALGVPRYGLFLDKNLVGDDLSLGLISVEEIDLNFVENGIPLVKKLNYAGQPKQYNNCPVKS